MNLEKLFDSYVNSFKEFKRLKKEYKARNKKTDVDTSQVLSLAEAQVLIDGKLEDEQKDKEMEKAERVYEASSDDLIEALYLLKNRVQIPYEGENYIVYVRKGRVKMDAMGDTM